MSVIRVRNELLLLTVGLYLLLSSGFMQFRIPPVAGGGVPVGELVLVLALLTFNPFVVLGRLQRTIFLFPFVLWWGFGIVRALAGVPAHGFWALRDATHVIESLFLIVGFAFAYRPQYLDRFFEWLPKLMVVGCVYALTYPFGDLLRAFSPVIQSAAGPSVSILFNYNSTSVLLLMAAAYLMLFKEKTQLILVPAAILVAYAIILFQARTIYLQIFALLVFFSFFRREALGKSTFAVIITVLVLLIIPLVGLQIQGRLGQQVSLDFVISHLLTLGGVESGVVGGGTGGLMLRLLWWNDVFNNWIASFENFVLGRGYGIPLTDFVSRGGTIVREPHNSYVSIIARMGLVGAVAFVWMHLLMLRAWYHAYRACKRLRWREGQNRLFILMVFFILIWVYAIGEDAFEKPYLAIPYYFFWGITLQMAWLLRRTPEAWRRGPAGGGGGRPLVEPELPPTRAAAGASRSPVLRSPRAATRSGRAERQGGAGP